MNISDLPKNLQVEGVEIYTGENKVVKLSGKKVDEFFPIFYPQLTNEESA